jgi:predicted LPLAT superfamily acyltransferase
MGASDGANGRPARSAGWSRIAERGSLAGIRFTAWCYRLLGRRLTLPLVYAVVSYFFLTDAAGRAASLAYLRRVYTTEEGRRAIGRPPGWRESYRHYRSFALAIVDRLDVWFGGVDDFSFEQFGKHEIDRYTDAGRGALILGAHLGSFDVLRGLARQSGVVVNVVMFTAHAELIQTVLRELSPEIEEHVIAADPSSVQSIFAIRERLRRGEHVAILADRIEAGDRDRSLTVPLLGGLVRLPQTPILMAGLLGCPVVLLLALRTGPGGYRVYTELLAERVRLPRGSQEGREAAVTEILAHYAQRLEHHIRLAPFQWFNFFDYWGDAATPPPLETTT